MKEVVEGGKNSNPLFKDGQDQFAVLYDSADAIDLDGIATQYDRHHQLQAAGCCNCLLHR